MTKCYDIVCMRPQAFQGFCDILRRDGGLQDTQRASVEEQVAKFLHIISHNAKNRTISLSFFLFFFFFAVLVRQLAAIFIEC